MNKDELKNKIKMFVESKNLKMTIYVLGSIFILFFVFQAGMIAGFKKASFRHDWGTNYERNFGPMRGAPQFIDDIKGAPNAHGAIGKIIKIEFPNIVVLDKDQTEKVIIIKDDTSILERKEKISKEKLLIDQFIVVIGIPNDAGQIEAKLIRIMPSPEEMMNNDVSGINSGGMMSGFNNKNI